MKRFLLPIFIAGTFIIQAQENTSFYATMDVYDAKELQKHYPHLIEILKTKQNKAAVYLVEEAIHKLHDKVLTHGPGFVYQPSEQRAIDALDIVYGRPKNTYVFSITEEDVVAQALDLVNSGNISNHIIELESYGTRFHTYPQAEQAVLDLKETWETMIADAGRTDITVRIYNHNNTTMPSLILTIEGAETPDEFVITGGHIDSTSFQGNGNAPGADDNASGIATLTEALRVLLELEYVPQKTIEIMAYAAEEIGLVGSAEIAEEYANNNVNVISYVQFDMTGYQGSASDIYIATDDYNSENLNSFLIELIQFYNSSGSHQLSYGLTVCNYGCSDHYSWAQNGYEAAFPFEAAFGQHNPNIHMASDTYSFLGNADHAAKFTKLALQYLIETAKVHQAASVDDLNQNRLRVFTQNNRLYYETLSGDSLENLALYDLSGKLLMLEINPASSGEISLESLASGVYMCSFEVSGKGIYIKKILVH